MTKREQAARLKALCATAPQRVIHLWHGTDRAGARRILRDGALRGGPDGFPPGVTARPAEAHTFAIMKGRARGVVLGVDVRCADIARFGIEPEVGGSQRNEFLVGDAGTVLPVAVRSVVDYSGVRPRIRSFRPRRNASDSDTAPPAALRRAFETVASRAPFPLRHALAFAPCPLADADHARSPRQYMHTFHDSGPGAQPPGTICVARAALSLKPEQLEALFAHEVGHLMTGRRGSEAGADRAGERLAQRRIRYGRDAVQTFGPGVSRRRALAGYRTPRR